MLPKMCLHGALLTVVALHSAHVEAAETPANCGMTETTGCLNGHAYNYLDKKVCGRDVYDRSSTGCCHVADIFAYETDFCCNGLVNPKSVGTCARWTAELEAAAPACWDCSGRRLNQAEYQSLKESSESEGVELETAVSELLAESSHESPEAAGGEEEETGDSQRRRLTTWPSPFPFDTVASGESPTPCNSIDDDRGCFNTYSYYYATDYICENWLMKKASYGCCDGTPYRLSTQTCCFLDDAYVVKNANHWCDCNAIECVPTYAPTEPAPPTGSPVYRPTNQPTLTYKPTWEATEPPSIAPSLSFRPTVASASQSLTDDDEVFKVNYLYGAAGVVFVGLAAVVYFQRRASSLIKERHEVAMEIADTNY